MPWACRGWKGCTYDYNVYLVDTLPVPGKRNWWPVPNDADRVKADQFAKLYGFEMPYGAAVWVDEIKRPEPDYEAAPPRLDCEIGNRTGCSSFDDGSRLVSWLHKCRLHPDWEYACIPFKGATFANFLQEQESKGWVLNDVSENRVIQDRPSEWNESPRNVIFRRKKKGA